MVTDQDFFTQEEAAEFVGVAARTVRRWVAEGKLSVERDGNKQKIARADLLPFKRYAQDHESLLRDVWTEGFLTVGGEVAIQPETFMKIGAALGLAEWVTRAKLGLSD